MRRLARRLQRLRRPCTLASSRSWRDLRICIVGAVWKLVDEGPWNHRQSGQVSLISAAPRCWEFTPEQLNSVSGRHLAAQFRTWLNRYGAPAADGFLVACLHGEFEPNRKLYRLHMHGVAAGGMIDVLDSLRKLEHFDISLDTTGPLIVKSDRLVLSRRAIEYLPHAISYQFKSYWLSRWVGPVGESQIVRRARWGQRIPEPHHAELLVWFDRHRIEEITLLMKVRVGKQGLVLTQPANVERIRG